PRLQVTSDPLHLRRVSFIRAAFEAGRKTHLHLRVNAAGKGGIGVQFKGATAHLEQIQRVVQELLRYGPRPEGAVIQRAARGAPDPGSYISARIGILQVESNHRRWIEAQALLVS